MGDSCTMANSSQRQAIEVRCVEGSRYQVISGYMLSKSGEKKEEEQRLKSTDTWCGGQSFTLNSEAQEACIAIVIFWEPEPCPRMENEGEGRIDRQQQKRWANHSREIPSL